MSVYRVVTKEDPFLREVAIPVKSVNSSIKKLIVNMLETMEAEGGVGLAAPQIGVQKRVLVVDIGEGPFVLINPEIKSAEGSAWDLEGCLSCPGLTGEVERYTKIEVEGLDEDGEETHLKAEDFMARVIQHEIDHLNGILFIDKAKDIRSV